MRIDVIDVAIDKCAAHLSPGKDVDEILSGLLTNALLVLICAEFEKKFREMIKDRCSSVSDRSVKSYIDGYTETALRGLKTTDVSGLLGKFGDRHKREFRRRLDGNRKSENMYNSLINNRHRVAHEGVHAATFADIKEHYEEGLAVLDCFREALWIPDENGAE